MARILSIALLLVTAAFAQATPTQPSRPPRNLPQITLKRNAEYRGLNCGNSTLPEPLATPDPLLNSMTGPTVVDFIVGPDGRVYSAFILESEDQRTGREFLRVFGSWRFRPATCNGVPSTSEGEISFSPRQIVIRQENDVEFAPIGLPVEHLSH